MLKRVDKFLGKLFRKNKRNIRPITVITVVVLSFAMIFKGVMQIPQIKENKKNIQYLKDCIEYETKRQAEIDELKDKVDTDEYIEKIAGDKLGLVKNNAKIFIDVSE